MTTAGSLALQGSSAPRDAFVAAKLRAAGAVILGKTNLSEWANFRSTKSTSGWSGRGGQVRNPYALDRNPCGSSSGTGAAIAANLAAIGVGTETDGSIVCPSGANALVGIKPTVGLVSRAGIIPISRTQDTAGPMARSVADAAILLSAMTGVDPADAATRPARADLYDSRESIGKADALRGARIGIARKRYFGYSPAADRLIDDAIADMKAQGAIIVDHANIPTAGRLDDCEFEILLYEFKADLNKYLAARGASAPVQSLTELIAFTFARKNARCRSSAQEIPRHGGEERSPDIGGVSQGADNLPRPGRGPGSRRRDDPFPPRRIVAPTGSPAWADRISSTAIISWGPARLPPRSPAYPA